MSPRVTPPRLLLASTSPYRRELLARLGVPFDVQAPRCDEEALKRADEAAAQQALRLAREKALSVAALEPDACVIGCDQLLDLDGQVLGKPGSEENAVAQLLALQARSHRLLTALVLACPGGQLLSHLDLHVLTMQPLDRAAAQRYVAADKPLDCAGSYKIEARGIGLFTRVEGEDFTAITGLPLLAVARLLRTLGFSIP
jgi:septum formation protein